MAKYVKFIVLSLLMSMILVGCSSISTQGDEDEAGTIRLSQLLESDDLVLYFVWDERSNNIEQLNENTKVDISSRTLVFRDGGVYVLNSTYKFNDFDDMTLKELLNVPQETIDAAVESGDDACEEYKLVGYTNDEGEIYQVVLLTVEECEGGGRSGNPFYFENSFSKEINGENYIGFYIVNGDGLQVCLAKYEDVTIIFDKEKDMLMDITLQDAMSK